MATLQNTTINSTGFLTIPVGNTTQRPGSPTNGMLRFNTDTGQIEVYNSGATAWGSITGPTISQIQITDSSYNVLDDTAVNTAGGYIKITGTGFGAGAVVVIGGVNATSTTVVNSTILNVQVPAQVAGTYTVYVVNTNGGTAIGVNGLTYSALPNWVTGSTLPNGQSGTAISIQLNATDATSYALAPANTLPTGLTLTSGGLLSGTVTVGSETTYSFTIIATDAQLQDSPRAFTITISVGDPYFYLTTLLLAGNGTNNGTNNTFVDGSTNNFTITRNGNTTQGTFSPFSQTGWSNYFDGNGDYLSIADNAALDLGTGDFTIECWVHPVTGISNVDGVISKRSQSTFTGGDWRIAYISANTAFGIACGSNTTDRLTPAITLNAWNHIAFVRSSGTLSCYANGVRGDSLSWTDNLDNAEALLIGLNVAGYDFPGYISNVRIVKGIGVYSGATYTVPIAPLTAIANTSLLTCQSNRFIDNSTNNFTITRNGDVSVQSFSPFAPGTSYNTNAVGGSGYFDGTGDNVSATLTGQAPGTGNFTYEVWVYPLSVSNFTLWNTRSADTSDGFSVGIGSGTIYVGYANQNFITGSNAMLTNVWTHIAVVRNSGTITLYVNGVNSGSAAKSDNFTSTTFYCGGWPTYGATLTGYLSSYRYVNGSAVYTTNFTPPTAPLTAISGTQLLLNFTNGQILDSTSKNLLETVGDAKISTAESKWGGSSMYFDGTGDWLQIPYNEYYNIGSSNYTVEAWIKTTVTTGEIVSAFSSSSPFPGWLFGIGFNNNDGKLKFYNANGSSSESFTSTGTVNNNNWNHVAVTKSGTSLRFFINGTLDSTHTMTIVGTGSNQPILIGADNNPSKGRYYTGYINDLRITKGYARYTTNFTPPSSAFPTQ